MSAVVVVLVALLAYLYIRNVRGARERWLRKLDLVGRWHWDNGDLELQFSGGLDRGECRRSHADSSEQGSWRLSGHTLQLDLGDGVESYDLNYFRAGSIGLEDSNGTRRVFLKVTDNIVQLDRVRH